MPNCEKELRALITDSNVHAAYMQRTYRSQITKLTPPPPLPPPNWQGDNKQMVKDLHWDRPTNFDKEDWPRNLSLWQFFFSFNDQTRAIKKTQEPCPEGYTNKRIKVWNWASHQNWCLIDKAKVTAIWNQWKSN